MVILFPIVLVAAGILVWRGSHRAVSGHGAGWRWFGAWAAAGAALTFAFLTGFSVGLLVLPGAAALTLWAARSSRRWAEAIGFVAGFGLVVLVVGLGTHDYAPCPSGGLSLPPGSAPRTSVSCGGMDPTPWLRVGAVVTGVALVGYAVLRSRSRA